MKYNLMQPFFVKSGAIKMDAIEKWKDKSYLKQKFNNIPVKVEQYKSNDNMEISKGITKTICFNDYIDNLHSGWYLAYSGLRGMNINKDIYSDIHNPYLSGPFEEKPMETLLFLGKDTKTGAHLHVSPYDFVLHQVVGRKIVHLLDFDQLTLNPVFHSRFNFSKENFFKLDRSKYKVYTFELEPGDVLYLPPWMWHAVENIGYTIGVTKLFERDDIYLKLKRFKQLKHRSLVQSLMGNVQSLVRKLTLN